VRYVSAGVGAATAADAAALAAAPLTFAGFGAASSPEVEAERYARLNGASLVSCRCPFDPSWSTRTVEVVVTAPVELALFGRRELRAVGRAEFTPIWLYSGRQASSPKMMRVPSLSWA
jgi:hypothetical protein